MYRSASRPRAVSAATADRSTSPEARTGRPSRSPRIGAWVPLPAPGAPSTTRILIGRRAAARTERRRPAASAASSPSADEAFVVAHHQLRLELLHGLDDDAHHDQQARAAEADPAKARDDSRDDLRGHGDDPEEERPGNRDPEDDP